MERDYIIVGQGLAGSVLALTLMQQGAKVMVVNKTNPDSSSMVAAGIFNPITGKEMKRTWQADKLFPALHLFYAEAEKLTHRRFFHPREIYRPFLSFQEQNDWMAKSAEEAYAPYIAAIYNQSKHSPFVYDPYGGIALKQCGYVDIPIFLDACKHYLLESNSYNEAVFNEADLKLHEDHITYQGIHAKKIIYCNGLATATSKFFAWLPFRPVKGELLLMEFSQHYDVIFNRGVFMLPYNGNISKVGATYDWRNLDLLPTENAKKELLEKLNKLTPMTFTIVGQKAGIRPATKDRRPFIGLHPEHKTLGVFNGLGTKGVSLAPYFADRFAAVLERKTTLDTEVNINRYFF